MGTQCVQRLVVEGSHQLGGSRSSVWATDAQCPLFFLPWSEPVTECCPSGQEPFVGHRTGDGHNVSVQPALFHPRIIQAQTVAILGFVDKLAVVQLAFEVQRTLLHDLLAREDGIEHVQALV